jgi:hypothetical protein
MNKLKIKVIKKNASINYNLPIAAEKKSPHGTERQIAANISGWVSEFQQRRREESKHAFNQLFALST